VLNVVPLFRAVNISSTGFAVDHTGESNITWTRTVASGMDTVMKCGCALLADNHPNMLAGVRSLLEDLFDVVVMVADEVSLFQAITKMTPDLVVVDLSLPVSGSCNIMRALSSRCPGLRVIVLSVHDEPEAVAASLSAGAAGFVLKRTAVRDLVEAVQAVQEGKTYVSPAVFPRSP
jgi:DNA-binding NarL/FixJ family response regulator